MPTDEEAGLARLRAVSGIIESVKTSFADAKKLHIDIRFGWEETDFYEDGAELCPVVKVDVERA